MALVGSINFLLGMESSKFTAGANRGIKDLNRLKGAATGLQGVLGSLGLGIGLHQVTQFLGESIRAFEEQEKATRKLDAVLEATGHTAGFTAEELEKQASALQRLTAVGDETITSAQAVLATFRRVNGDAFERGTKLALDMSAVLEKDLQSSVVAVGKALNDPITGLTSLAKMGVKFTDVQKEMIKEAMAQNDILTAQGVILSGLSDRFGGAAEAMATDLDKLKNSWEELKESVGKGLGEMLNSPEGGGPGFLEKLTAVFDAISAEGAGPMTLRNAQDELDRRHVEKARREIIDATPQWVRDEELANQMKEANAIIERNGLASAKRMLTFNPRIPQLGEAIRAHEANAIRDAERQERLARRTGMGGALDGGAPGINTLMWNAITEAATKVAIEANRQAGMLGGLDAAALHAIDSAIDRTRPADMGADMPELRDRQFAGAAMRGSEEAFRTIAAFQGSRAPERAEQQRERQIKALEQIQANTVDNAIEILVTPIA